MIGGVSLLSALRGEPTMPRPQEFMVIVAIGCASVCGSQAAPIAATAPIPVTNVDGPILTFEFPGLLIGAAEYAEGPTGTTVFDFPGKVKAAVDVRGGSPVTVFTDSLRQGYDEAYVDAIVLSGGSAYGLASVAGVAEEIKHRSPDPGDWNHVAVVPGAVIFDLGDRRYNAVTPDVALGRAALQAAVPGRFPLGAHGAGRFAMQGGYFGPPQHSGQGGAYGRYGPTRIAVFTVVNALGAVVDRSGHVTRCGQPSSTTCGTIVELLTQKLESRHSALEKTGGSTAHTTVSIVVTNQKMPDRKSVV
jgi:L-aminopeptidase/D-esterase-like protein